MGKERWIGDNRLYLSQIPYLIYHAVEDDISQFRDERLSRVSSVGKERKKDV